MKWPTVKLGELAKIRTGKLDANKADENGIYPFFTCAIEPLRINTHAFDCKAVLVAGNGDLNVKYYEGKFNAYQRTYVIESLNEERLLPRYLYLFLNDYVGELREMAIGGVIKYIKLSNLTDARIPLPSLDEQKRITATLDKAENIKHKRDLSFNKIHELVESIFENIFGDIKNHISEGNFIKLSDATKKIVTYGIVQAGPDIKDGVPYIKTGDIKNGEILVHKLSRTSREIADAYARSQISTNDIVMSIRATVGTTALVPSCLNGANLTQGTARISAVDSIEPLFLLHYLRHPVIQQWIQKHVKGATFREITLTKLRELPVYIPSMKLQKKFINYLSKLELQKSNAIQSERLINELFLSLQNKLLHHE